ncbi:hypothetical protein IT403_02825 [Candidatus Nomurabacteria bacterium]|nr:hypothetical protein [Candidatus Nomurabacteria bacterium]
MILFEIKHVRNLCDRLTQLINKKEHLEEELTEMYDIGNALEVTLAVPDREIEKIFETRAENDPVNEEVLNILKKIIKRIETLLRTAEVGVPQQKDSGD